MLAEKTLRRYVAPRTLTRGDAYYAQGRVRRIEKLAGGLIEARVQGSLLYTVVLVLDGDELTAQCDCPWFQDNYEECKHIWAAIRAASERRMLPDRALVLSGSDDYDGEPFDVDDEPYSDFDRYRRFPRAVRPREQPPAWQRFLEAVGTAPPPVYSSSNPNVPEEIAYVIESYAAPQRLILQIQGRAHKKNGEWGKWKSLSLRIENLHLLPQFDRETLALLNPNAWSYTVERSVTISPTSTAWWIERLARAGKLGMTDGSENPRMIGWDDGPPWTLRVGIVNDAAESKYRVDATIEREGESLPFDRVDATFPDILVADGRASRFDDGGRESWLRALRANRNVESPHKDADRFRKALLRAPIANIALPEELGWTLVDVRPQPVLALENQSWTSELSGELFFVYDEWRVSSRSSETQSTVGRKLIRRNRAFEQDFSGRLGALGVISTSDGYRVRQAQVEDVARTLMAEGWIIEIDSSKVHVADDLDVEISSGIDWFDLNVSATFDDVRVKLPELLAAA
ncbi:MAG: SWIM zinc finger family protein, partial [bacterium]